MNKPSKAYLESVRFLSFRDLILFFFSFFRSDDPKQEVRLVSHRNRMSRKTLELRRSSWEISGSTHTRQHNVYITYCKTTENYRITSHRIRFDPNNCSILHSPICRRCENYREIARHLTGIRAGQYCKPR